MRNYIARRFQTAQDSVMASAAAEKGAYSDLIDLSIGDTDFTTDERIIRAAMEDALAGHTHYTSPQGDPELIDEIRTYYRTAHNMDLAREQVFISASSCFGMELALMSILDPGDEVILFAPYFSPYKEQVELTGGVAVEVPCLVNAHGINPCHVGRLPVQLAAMNQTNINVQLLTIEAARTRDRNHIYQAAMLDPHTAAELSVDDIRSMCDELIEAHGEYMAMYR